MRAQLGHSERERAFHYDYCRVNDVLLTLLEQTRAGYAGNLNKFEHTRAELRLSCTDEAGAMSYKETSVIHQLSAIHSYLIQFLRTTATLLNLTGARIVGIQEYEQLQSFNLAQIKWRA